MGYSVSECVVLTLNEQKSDLEFRLTMITNRLAKLSTESADLSTQYQNQTTSLSLLSDSDDESTLDVSDEWNQLQLNYSAELNKINAKEKQIQAEQTTIQTQLKEIEAMIESYDKLTEDGIKDSAMSSK